MSASAAGVGGVARPLRFWSTTNGKKAVMALSGVFLAGFVAAHLLGNLQIFIGPDKFNNYARELKQLPALLWSVRLGLLVMAALHVWSSLQLAVAKSEARPQGYVKRTPVGSTYAARSMYITGPILAAFVVYHLMQFTFGVGGTTYVESDPYGNVMNGFRVPAVSIFYTVAMALLCLHLRHGLWSILQTLGFHHPRYSPRIRAAATVVAILIFLGFISIPIAVLAGAIPQIF
jgi:succinate dehydrogenase cytochrome b subunit